MQEIIKTQKSGGNLEKSICKQVFDEFTNRLPNALLDRMLYSECEINYANQIDYFQFHYARYLCNICKSGHRAFFEFRAFIEHPLFKESHYERLLSEIESFLLQREMYESLIVFVKTNKKFKKELQNARINQTI